MTTNQTLRIPDRLVTLLDQAAQEQGMSRHQLVLDTLAERFAPPGDLDAGLVLGYVELRGTEIDPEEVDCPECGAPLVRPHIGFTAGLTQPVAFGPVCALCADTE
jgi:hypothetical protein